MTITCAANESEGHTYTFINPPRHWKLPKGYMIKMREHNGDFAEVVKCPEPALNFDYAAMDPEQRLAFCRGEL